MWKKDEGKLICLPRVLCPKGKNTMETYLFTQSIMDPQGKNTLWKLICWPMAKNIMLNKLSTNYYFFYVSPRKY